MLYLIDIHWERRQQESGRAQAGFSTYAENARALSTAKGKAIRKFNRHFGMHLRITKTVEKPDPAGIFKGSAGVSPVSSR